MSVESPKHIYPLIRSAADYALQHAPEMVNLRALYHASGDLLERYGWLERNGVVDHKSDSHEMWNRLYRLEEGEAGIACTITGNDRRIRTYSFDRSDDELTFVFSVKSPDTTEEWVVKGANSGEGMSGVFNLIDLHSAETLQSVSLDPERVTNITDAVLRELSTEIGRREEVSVAMGQVSVAAD